MCKPSNRRLVQGLPTIFSKGLWWDHAKELGDRDARQHAGLWSQPWFLAWGNAVWWQNEYWHQPAQPIKAMDVYSHNAPLGSMGESIIVEAPWLPSLTGLLSLPTTSQQLDDKEEGTLSSKEKLQQYYDYMATLLHNLKVACKRSQ